MKKGNKYGTHRVLEPKGVLPQPALKIDNDMNIYDNEILIDVIALNVDSASFTQIADEVGHDENKIGARIMEIVSERGKQQNPVTGSGGMLIGTVKEIGPALEGKTDLKVGDKIATLVSLSLTPLKINAIKKVYTDIDRVEIDGQAILFESGIYAVLPDDMSETLALAALDVAGAPAQALKLAKPGNTVLVLGAAGKSGLMCCYEAKKGVGENGKVIGLINLESDKEMLEATGFCDEVIVGDATNAIEVLDKVHAVTNGKDVDVSINVVNVMNTEMASILPVRDEGIVYFFSMATSFTKAALGAEGVGKDVTMMIGNGYTKGHAKVTLDALRESKTLRDIFEKKYL
ncbi:MAG: L-erythro-3,5-diaminohexanoate dehydrogenase [Bacilli bacterium]|jgi:L-erythro-3,5-diaminohexanoate dehydrogenase|nr:L-erythro-3,5-diaminohexanoate dehydrogenase [Bacilli bacterium]